MSLRRWTAAEEALLGTMPDAALATRIGRTAIAIWKKRDKLGIPATTKPQSKGVRVCLQCGNNFSFYFKMEKFTPCVFCSRKCAWAAKSFPIGTERIVHRQDMGNVVLIKVEDTSSPNGTRWVNKATLIASKAIGTQFKSKKHKITFLDGDQTNVVPSNMLVTEQFEVLTCKRCGKLRRYLKSHINGSRRGSKRPVVCNKCCHAYHLAGTTKPTCKQPKVGNEIVSEIKAVVAYYGWNERSIKDRIRKLWSARKLSIWFGAGRSTIDDIRHGRRWKGIAMSKKKPWIILMERHDLLAQHNRADIFDRTDILSQVFDDPEFSRDIAKSKQNPLDLLNKKVSDTCADFMQLYQMRKLFPRKSQWVAGNLSEMRQRMIESLEGGANKGKKSSKVKRRHVITQADHEKLMQENKFLKEQISHLQSELNMAKETIGILKQSRTKAA